MSKTRLLTVRIISAATMLFALSPPVQAVQPSKAVRQTLANIKSVVGYSVLDRMKACGITFADGSSAEKLTQDNANLGVHKGDIMLDVYINIPPLPDQDPAAYSDLLARWAISRGVAKPMSGWAESLQNKPTPIGSMTWMNC